MSMVRMAPQRDADTHVMDALHDVAGVARVDEV